MFRAGMHLFLLLTIFSVIRNTAFMYSLVSGLNTVWLAFWEFQFNLLVSTQSQCASHFFRIGFCNIFCCSRDHCYQSMLGVVHPFPNSISARFASLLQALR